VKRSTANLTLYFGPEDREVAQLAETTFFECSRLITDLWGVSEPRDCRVQVMTSWPSFIVRSAPWHLLPLLALTFPLWGVRAARIWPLAGGWELSMGGRRTVGVKPPRLLASASSSVGKEIFEPDPSVEEKFRSVLCHELTHAFTSHLKLPAWLKEGLAMATVDEYFGRRTVRLDTLAVLETSAGRLTPRGRVRLDVRDRESLVYLYVYGYWLTRYVLETAPDTLRSLLQRRRAVDEVESSLASGLRLTVDEFRTKIDLLLAHHFAR
jgi:hypothetical protein